MHVDMPSAGALSITDPLPTRAEFGRRLSADRRRFYWAIGLCCAAVLLLFVGMSFNAERMNRAGVPPGADERFTLWDGLLAFIPFAVLIGGIWWADRRSQTKCPACRQSLFTAHDPYIAMVTGRCPKCAAPMFADDVHDGAAQQTILRSPTAAREAFVELARTFRPAIPWGVGGAALLTIGILAEPMIAARYQSQLGDLWMPILRPALVTPGVVVGCLALWIWARSLNSRSEPCPACGGTIGGWARKTGRCSTCGRQVVNDAIPGMQPRDDVATRLWSIDVYQTAAKDRHSRLWIGCFVGGGLATLWCTPLFIYQSQQPHYYVQSAWEMIAYVVTIFGLGVMQCVGVWWWDRRLASGLHCPECHHELLHFYPLVVSSQRCCHCGCQVLETPVPQSAA